MGHCFEKETQQGPRELHFAYQERNKLNNFPTNQVHTAKYTWLSFFPIALIIQFRRLANVYFVFIAVLESLRVISPVNPFAAWAPLIFVLLLSMLREGVEDYRRHKTDDILNRSPCRIYKGGGFKDFTWKDIQVGDIIKVKEKEVIPADIVVVATNFESGLCYIETASLDGEKNLKPRMAPKETIKYFHLNEQQITVRIEGKIQCEGPNPDLRSFSGTMYDRKQKILLTIKQFLYRGSVLKNTKFVIAIVVYTGMETKIVKNSETSKYKQSQVNSKFLL